MRFSPKLTSLALSLAAASGHAHDAADVMPSEPGWRLAAAAALTATTASTTWPAPSWPGVLAPAAAADARGLRLEHATLDGALRLTDVFGARLAVGAHAQDAVHVETAVLQARWPLDAARLVVHAGRESVPLGDGVDAAGQYDAFIQPPLAKAATLGPMWTADGVRATWQTAHTHTDGLRAAELGVWRSSAYPDAPGSPPALSARLHAGWGAWQTHLGWLHLRPEGRGSAMQGNTQGHSHGALDCRASLAQRLCVDGASDLLAATLAWQDGAWALAATGIAQRERGRLYTASADVQRQANTQGIWLDARWQAAPGWQLAARAERLVPSQHLSGWGASALAEQTGLAAARPVARLTLAAARQLAPGWQLGAEAGREIGATAVTHAALRLVWQPAPWRGDL